MLTLRQRGRYWWAYWRDVQHRQRFRSTRQEDYAKAMRAAAFMVIEDTKALAPAEDKPRTDATITDIVAWYREFMADPPQNLQERRPQAQTAVRYMRNTTRLAGNCNQMVARLHKGSPIDAHALVILEETRCLLSDVRAKLIGVEVPW